MTQIGKLHSLLTILAINASVVASSHAEINFNGDFSGNLAATSTYMWRGTPQSLDAAIQAGVDYADPSGVHLGAWTSNASLSFGSEVDFIAGYAGTAEGIDYDAGLIAYRYPQAPSIIDADFVEFYAGISQGALSAKFSSSSDKGEYIEVAGDFPVKTWLMTAHLGNYSRDKIEDYTDYSVTFSKPMSQGYHLSLMISDTDLPADDYRTTIILSTDFKP